MNILIAIGLIALCYFIVYGVFRLLSAILVAIRLPWAAVIAGCTAIVIHLSQYSFLNYIVVIIAIILLGRLLFKQFFNTLKKPDKEEYHETLGEAYACVFSFLTFGTLYANLNYILSVQIAGMSVEEYKEAGFFMGKALSAIGFGPVKWFILILAAVALYQATVKTTELEMIPSSQPKDDTSVTSKKSTIGSYYSSVMGLPISFTENTVEANRLALKDYFFLLLQNHEEAEKLSEATLNVAAFELSDSNEILESLIADSGLSKEKILKCFPKLKPRSE